MSVNEQKKPQMSVVPVNEVIQRGDFAMLPGCDPKPVTELTGKWVGEKLYHIRRRERLDHQAHVMVILRPEQQPEPEPEWFDLTPHDGHVLRTSIDHVSKGHRFSEVDGLSGWPVGFAKRNGYTQFRCLLKDAPPELLEKTKKPTCINTFDCNAGDHADACPASKPVESPDDWVTITDPNHIARRDIDHIRVLNQKTEPVIGLAGLPKRQIISELLCRRRDLPPIPEPKPATQTIVFHEVLNLIGIPDRYVMEWWSEIPFGAIPTGKTVTREVVR